jgi:hypothetical protein
MGLTAGLANGGPVNIASIQGSETITPASDDLVTVVDISDGNKLKTATVSSINTCGADAKVGVDAAATADYLGAANNDGALRTDSTINYADGGDYVTLSLPQDISTTATVTHANVVATNNITQAGNNVLDVSSVDDTTISVDLTTGGHELTVKDGSIGATQLDSGAQPTFIGVKNTVQTLTDAATVAVDMALGYDMNITFGGNRAMGTPSNLAAGQSGVITAAAGASQRTITFPAAYRLNGVTSPGIVLAANSVGNKIYMHCSDGSVMDIQVVYG